MVDWVHCNQCFYLLGQQPKRELILTSCGHIFCNVCEREGQIECCKVCRARGTTLPLSSKMPDDVRFYFEDVGPTLQKAIKVNDFQNSHRSRLSGFFKSTCEKYQQLKFAYKSLEAEYQKLKCAYRSLDENSKKLRKQCEMYRNSHETPPPPSPQFHRKCQETPAFMRLGGEENSRPNSPLFVTPTRPASSRQGYRQQNTPSTPLSDSGISPGSETSQQSYQSAVSQGSQTRMYRPGLTPPLHRLSLLSVRPEHGRESRY